MSSLVANGLVLPEDIWAHVANFVSLRVGIILSITCKELHNR